MNLPPAGAAVLLLASCAPPAPAAPPDLVVILADDLDVATLAAGLNAGLYPAIAAELVDQGMSFTESFVSFSQCCPSRATFLTGRYAHNHGVLSNLGASGGFRAFDDRSTLATWLDDAGYTTALVGKYLNGYDDPAVVPPGWDSWRALVGPSAYCMYDWSYSRDGALTSHGSEPSDYQTDVLAALAADVVREAEAGPLFLLAAPLAPHLESACGAQTIRPAPRHLGTAALPLPRPPSLNEPDLSDKPAWMATLAPVDEAALTELYRARLEAVRAVDDLVATVLTALDDVGRLDGAVIVFTSDNGYVLGEHRWLNKVVPYEASIRVPLIVRGAGTGARAALVGNIDLAPTLADLAGVAAGGGADGTSLVPLLTGLPARWRERLLLHHPDADIPDPQSPPYRGVRTAGGLVYVETYDWAGDAVTDRELYDLAADPHQLDSRDGTDAALEAQLAADLAALASCAGETCRAAEWARATAPP